MANVTPTVLIVTRDPDVKQVSSMLHTEGITSKTAASPAGVQRFNDPALEDQQSG